jgi:tRNA pseudouridine32 synthase/23S rRNA pseudouridine746 synthase
MTPSRSTPPPPIDGLLACRVVLLQGAWPTMIEALCARFAKVPREEWLARIARGHVLHGNGAPIAANDAFRAGIEVFYYREFSEQPIPVVESILHADDRLVVVDKPHFLPVIPAGKYRRETLVARLIARTGNPHLTPLHRIDRGTAGLVMFSADPASRSAYHSLFRDRAIRKRYEALAAPLPAIDFPVLRNTRLVRCDDYFRMQEVDGEPNTHTRIEVIERGTPWWRYALYPHSGKMHQLRVHMAALGAPIANDPWYPDAEPVGPDDLSRPLKLLAQSLTFVDPIDGSERRFETRLQL